jgi:hypothetical protein
MMASESTRAWLITIALSILSLGGAVLAGEPSPLRLLLTLWFLLVCPGVAWIRLLRLGDQWVTLTIGVALSIALDIIVSGAMMYAGLWNPEGSLVVLIGITGVAVAIDVSMALRERARRPVHSAVGATMGSVPYAWYGRARSAFVAARPLTRVGLVCFVVLALALGLIGVVRYGDIGPSDPSGLAVAARPAATLIVDGSLPTPRIVSAPVSATPIVAASPGVSAADATVVSEPLASPLQTATIPAQRTPTAAAAAVATATRGGPTSRRDLIRFSTYQTDPQGAQIGTVSPDGTDRQVLGTIPGHPWRPRFSPDGTRFLYASAAPAVAGRVGDLDLNGTGSPDIWIANADGSQARRLTEGSARYNGWSWSPDGRWIAFASNQSGSWDIYKMQLSDALIVRLSVSSSQDGWPTWTPDGLGLVFVSTRSDRAQLYAMDANGGGARRFLITATADTDPAIAPDGRIAFSAQDANGASEIYVLDRGAAIPRRLTNTGSNNSQPMWSPDGTRLVFIGQYNGRSDVYQLNADGSGLVQLTTMGQNQYPDWGFIPARP